jgi:hypothetical protein
MFLQSPTRAGIAWITLILLGLTTIVGGCAADTPAQDNRARTASEFIGQQRPAP